MSIPHRSILLAALRWMVVLSRDSIERSKTMLRSVESYRDLTPSQYDEGYRWLRKNNFISDSGRVRYSEDFAEAILKTAMKSALWFENADAVFDSVDDLPTDIDIAAETLNVGPERVSELIRVEWHIFDAKRRAEIGALGEDLVVAHLREIPGTVVEQVSLISDAFGYDITLKIRDKLLHVEVKSSIRTNTRRFYLSRNEWSVSKIDPNWHLIYVTISGDEILNLHEVPRELIHSLAPVNHTSTCRWESARFDVSANEIIPGLKHLLG